VTEPITDVHAQSLAIAEQRRQLEERRLSDYMYSQRRAMLVMAALTFAITWGGVHPSAISAFGLQITKWNESNLIFFSSLVLAYLIGNFASLAKPSMVGWQTDFNQWVTQASDVMTAGIEQISQGTTFTRLALDLAQTSDESSDQVKEILANVKRLFAERLEPQKRLYLDIHRSRFWFEYQVPVAIALVVLYLVFIHLLLSASY
jgi:hypothetical protein